MNQDLGGEMDIENEEYFFDLRSRLLDLMAKFKDTGKRDLVLSFT
jgi:hypothetical protein